jgi:cysteine dioxygenase
MNATLLDDFPLEVCLPRVRFGAERYTKTLLKRTPVYEIFLLCWKSGQATAIHDHPSDGCWMRVLQGCLEETEYAYPTLEKIGYTRFGVGEYGFKRGNEVLHSIRAIEDSVSVHVYYPPGYVANTYAPPISDNPPSPPRDTHQCPPQNGS